MTTSSGSASTTGASWVCLAIGLGAAFIFVAAAVTSGSIGLAVSGLGSAILGASGFIHPLSFTSPLRRAFRIGEQPPQAAVVLSATGTFLFIVGVALRWAN